MASRESDQPVSEVVELHQKLESLVEEFRAEKHENNRRFDEMASESTRRLDTIIAMLAGQGGTTGGLVAEDQALGALRASVSAADAAGAAENPDAARIGTAGYSGEFGHLAGTAGIDGAARRPGWTSGYRDVERANAQSELARDREPSLDRDSELSERRRTKRSLKKPVPCFSGNSSDWPNWPRDFLTFCGYVDCRDAWFREHDIKVGDLNISNATLRAQRHSSNAIEEAHEACASLITANPDPAVKGILYREGSPSAAWKALETGVVQRPWVKK